MTKNENKIFGSILVSIVILAMLVTTPKEGFEEIREIGFMIAFMIGMYKIIE